MPLAEMMGANPVFPPFRAFVHRLRDLGWAEGRTVIIERRAAENHPERAVSILAELAARGVDVIVVGATEWLVNAAQRETQTIPIIAIFSRDPVAAGLVPCLARPGGNLTGVTTASGRDLYEKRLELLKELVPGITRVAFLGRRLAWESAVRIRVDELIE